MRTNQPIIARHVLPAFSTFVVLLLLTILLMQGCKKSDKPKVMKGIDMELLSDNFVSPIQVLSTHHSERRYVVDQIGKIWLIDRNNYKRPTPFLDLSSKLVKLNGAYDERGLLGLAFHPDYKTNGRFYVYYQLPPRAGGPAPGIPWDNLSRISEFHVLPDWSRADPNSEKVILEWDDPQSNHNGGSLVFGLDNFLYISIGDGGGANDVGPGHAIDWYNVNGGGNAQNLEANFLGKILCIDIDNGDPYGIPPNNPFVGKPGLDEIFAFGFRNPYRMSVDKPGHQIIVGDAGQVLWEEIDVLSKGGNYGWNVKEGRHCFSTADSSKVLGSCPSVDYRGKPLLEPVIELNNWQNPLGGKATAVIGGYVYHGDALKDWQDKYIFGSFSQTPTTPNGELYMATPQPGTDGAWPFDKISLLNHPTDLGYYLRGFGQDDDGELYLAVSSKLGPDGNTGKVYKIVPVFGE